MAGERTYPILACRALDDVVGFYSALGFAVSYRQEKPNPYLVVRRADIHLHFCAPPGYDPETALGSVIVVVPDADALYADFASGLRAAYGKLPVAGIPRILRPRRKRGTVAGFSVVDPGGNWLRISRAGDTEDDAESAQGLELALRSAARQGDARGDDATAARMLDAALKRHPDAPPAERAAALAYRTELALRLGDADAAGAALAALRRLDPAAADELTR